MSSSGMNTSRMRRPDAKNTTIAVRVAISKGLGSMNTMAPPKPIAHSSALQRHHGGRRRGRGDE